jgi:hypothetical protein
LAKPKPGTDRQLEQSDTAGGDVLANFAGRDRESLHRQLGEQLGVNEVHLTQVRLGRVLCDTRAVLDSRAAVRIALHARRFQKCDALAHRLAEGVRRASGDGRDEHAHY